MIIKDTVERIKRLFGERRYAYTMVFDPKNMYTKRVLFDLAKFCRAHEPTFHKDPRIHAMLEGRRDVWLRIQEQLNLNVDQIYELHKINIPGENK